MRKARVVTRSARAVWRSRALAAAGLILAMAGAAGAEARLELTLDEAIELGLSQSRELKVAEARVQAADARLWQARSGFLPQLSASGSYTRLDEAPYMDGSAFGVGKIYLGSEDIYSIGLSATQPLFTGGALLSAQGAAKHGANAEALARERTVDEVRYGVTGAYLGVVRAREALRVMGDAVAQMERHLEDVEALYEQGMVIQSDVMLARVRMDEVRLAKTAAEHAVSIAGAALAFALGVDLGTDIEPTDPLAGVEFPERGLEEWTAAALASRPDLKAAYEAVGAADNGVSIARAGFFPQVVAVGTYAWDRPDRAYEEEFYDHWNVTVAAEMNVFDWGGTWSRVREAKAGLTEAERSKELFEDAVRLEVKQSFLAMDEAAVALPIAEDGVAQAREALRVARESFQNGMATNSAVLDAQASLTVAEMSRIAALAGLRLAEAKLLLAAGVAGR